MFHLDPRLEKISAPITDLALCTVRLMNDGAFPWLMLIPRRNGVIEITDLSGPEQQTLMIEIDRVVRVMQKKFEPEKINIGALGNIVPQMHIHIVGRRQTDRAWPGPVWGSGDAQPYSPIEQEALVLSLRTALG